MSAGGAGVLLGPKERGRKERRGGECRGGCGGAARCGVVCCALAWVGESSFRLITWSDAVAACVYVVCMWKQVVVVGARAAAARAARRRAARSAPRARLVASFEGHCSSNRVLQMSARPPYATMRLLLEAEPRVTTHMGCVVQTQKKVGALCARLLGWRRWPRCWPATRLRSWRSRRRHASRSEIFCRRSLAMDSRASLAAALRRRRATEALGWHGM